MHTGQMTWLCKRELVTMPSSVEHLKNCVPGYFRLPVNRVRRGRSRYPSGTGCLPHDSGKDARRKVLIRLIFGLLVLAVSFGTLQGRASATEWPLFPMRFEWRQEGPPEICGKTCR